MSSYAHYRTWVFDCDGVIFDSNKVKTEAFRQVCQPFGEKVAEKLVAYHVQHGGMSRYAKFKYLLNDLLDEPASEERVGELASLYGQTVYSALLECQLADGLATLRLATPKARWMIVSGGDQNELRRLFTERNIAQFFDGEIFGSPANKDEILAREQIAGNLQKPTLFIGDSRYDHEAAQRAGINFVFASAWTEFVGWREYAAAHCFPVVSSVKDLIQFSVEDR